MDRHSLSLRSVPPEVLEAAWQLFNAMPSRARVVEDHVADEQLRAALVDFLGQPAWILAGILEAVLAERGTIEKAEPTLPGAMPRPVFKLEKRYGSNTPDLVWSGPMGGRSGARATRHVIDDLFLRAQRSVFIAGFSFYRAAGLFEPLRKRVLSLAERGLPSLQIRVVLDCSGIKMPGASEDVIAAATVRSFVESCPQVRDLGAKLQYYRPSALRDEKFGALSSMHAKCILVDDETALVGSANFSNRGRDDRNLEVGALITDGNFASVLASAWRDVEADLVGIEAPPLPDTD